MWEGVSTRRVDDLVKALGCEGISKSQVSRICQELDVVVDGFLGRPLDGGQKWLRKSEQGDKWNRCLIEGMIVLSETGARDEQTTPP